ncbi:hypothetical protein [Nocardia crassostreae]|uniref:hypothetical protein n=1 Tax=Nocardia crassostreae TaxID=53428 RepID=UPI000832658E|nr:hypothetical protein [Nocardia crassostreae]
MTVWLGGDGRPADAPLPPGSAVWEGIATALAVLTAAWVAAAGLDWWIALLLNHRRGLQWEAEWRGLGRPIET